MMNSSKASYDVSKGAQNSPLNKVSIINRHRVVQGQKPIEEPVNCNSLAPVTQSMIRPFRASQQPSRQLSINYFVLPARLSTIKQERESGITNETFSAHLSKNEPVQNVGIRPKHSSFMLVNQKRESRSSKLAPTGQPDLFPRLSIQIRNSATTTATTDLKTSRNHTSGLQQLESPQNAGRCSKQASGIRSSHQDSQHFGNPGKPRSSQSFIEPPEPRSPSQSTWCCSHNTRLKTYFG